MNTSTENSGSTLTNCTSSTATNTGTSSINIASSSSQSNNTNHTLPLSQGAVSQGDLLWVDKYKPKNIQEIIGSMDTIKKLQ